MRIMGIDPGIGRIGYGVAEQSGNAYRCITVGCFTTPKTAAPGDRLVSLAQQLTALIHEHQPAGAAVERLFFSKNVRIAFSVAEARGMILATFAKANIPIVELSPQHVKLGVTGYGGATKRQIQLMVQKLFQLQAPPTPDDAADALALAFAGLSHFPSLRSVR